MKNFKIEEHDTAVTVTVELNKREFINEPIERVNIDNVNSLITNSGKSLDDYKPASGPLFITNYVTKGNTEGVLVGSWTFEKKNVKKVEKNEIKQTAQTSKVSIANKPKRSRRKNKLT